MLEIPESHTIARQLNEVARGKGITSVAAGTSPHGFAFYFGDPAAYPALLEGRRIDGAEAIAGQVEITLGEARLLFHDGVNIRYLETGRKAPAKHQLYIVLDDGSSLVCTVQMYGGMWAFREGQNDNFYYLAAKEKPSPLTAAFDEAYFDSLWRDLKPTLSIKALLATEQRIPGLGNGVLQDILFEARINPQTKIASVTDSKKAALFGSVKKTLAAMTAGGGRDTEKDLFGASGGYRTKLSSKTVAHPCPVCGATIVRKAYMGGNVYFCPTCQP